MNRKAKSVLVVDDNKEQVRAVVQALETAGLEVRCAADGNLGLAIALIKCPDLMILGLMIPERSGFLVMEHLLLNSDVTIPVIVMTSNFGKRHQRYAEMLGARAYFHKPFNMTELLASAERILANDILQPVL